MRKILVIQLDRGAYIQPTYIHSGVIKTHFGKMPPAKDPVAQQFDSIEDTIAAFSKSLSFPTHSIFPPNPSSSSLRKWRLHNSPRRPIARKRRRPNHRRPRCNARTNGLHDPLLLRLRLRPHATLLHRGPRPPANGVQQRGSERNRVYRVRGRRVPRDYDGHKCA